MKNSLQKKIFNIVAVFIDAIHPIVFLFFLRFLLGFLFTNILNFQFDTGDIADRFYDFLTFILFTAIVIKNNFSMFKDISSKISNSSNLRIIVFGFFLGILFSCVLYVLSLFPFLDYQFVVYTDAINGMLKGSNSILILLLIVVFSPMIEEFYFRFHLMNILMKYFTGLNVLLIDSLLFALLHATSILWFVLAFIFSVISCSISNIKSFSVSVYLHLGFNSVNLLYYFLNNSFKYNYIIDEYQKYIYIFLFCISIVIIIVFFRDIIKDIYEYLSKTINIHLNKKR